MERSGRAMGKRGGGGAMPAAVLPTGERGNLGLEGSRMIGRAMDGPSGARKGGGRYEWL